MLCECKRDWFSHSGVLCAAIEGRNTRVLLEVGAPLLEGGLHSAEPACNCIAREAEAHRSAETRAAVVIQACCRGHLQRLYLEQLRWGLNCLYRTVSDSDAIVVVWFLSITPFRVHTPTPSLPSPPVSFLPPLINATCLNSKVKKEQRLLVSPHQMPIVSPCLNMEQSVSSQEHSRKPSALLSCVYVT